jgi:hypothetical protein
MQNISPNIGLSYVQLLLKHHTPCLTRKAAACKSEGMGSRMTWPQLQQSDEFRGRWVALDECKYDARTAQPIEGSVVDADEDLAELCSRIQQGDNRHCAILFCDGGLANARDMAPSSSRRPSFPPPPRGTALTH